MHVPLLGDATKEAVGINIQELQLEILDQNQVFLSSKLYMRKDNKSLELSSKLLMAELSVEKTYILGHDDKHLQIWLHPAQVEHEEIN